MSIDFAQPTTLTPLSESAAKVGAPSTFQGGRVSNSRILANNEASAHFDEISRKLSAGPLTLEYLVAYSIEAYSRR